MSENGLRKLFRINEIKIIMSVTGLHNKATYYYAFNFFFISFQTNFKYKELVRTAES
jgi:hypothetical protein